MTTTEYSSTLMLEEIVVPGYERVIRIVDSQVGLRSIIAIHDTTLGPALGGTRIFPYASESAALEDVLRLARGMTYKSAVAGSGFGGGKSVIIADPKKEKTPALLARFAQAVDSLEGKYICAEDVGCTAQDVLEIRKNTRYVVGLPHAKSSGDPGPFTAWGTFRGIQSIFQTLDGSDDLEGKRIAVQGLGNVGGYLVAHLFWAGAQLILSDLDPEKLRHFGSLYGAETVSPEEILTVPCDLFAPCAMGGVVNDATLSRFQCRAIAGSANNVLGKDFHAEMLEKRNILYAPDFVINAGGLLNVTEELEEKGYHPKSPRYKIHHIYDTLMDIYAIAKKEGISTHKAALALGDDRIRQKIGKRVIPPFFHHSAIA